MAIPAYLWLKDDGGALIKGSVDVNNRENSIEVTSFGHSLSIPTDSSNGKLTGTRLHGAMQIERILTPPAHIFIKQWQRVRRWNQQS
jgi:type VI secretion system secreted protein Hcp